MNSIFACRISYREVPSRSCARKSITISEPRRITAGLNVPAESKPCERGDNIGIGDTRCSGATGASSAASSAMQHKSVDARLCFISVQIVFVFGRTPFIPSSVALWKCCMQVVFTPWGSFGDLHPYLAVALEVKRRGYDVLISTSDVYRDKVEGEGLAV